MLNGLGRICCVTYDRKYGTPTGNELDSDGNVKSDSQTWYSKTHRRTLFDFEPYLEDAITILTIMDYFSVWRERQSMNGD